MIETTYQFWMVWREGSPTTRHQHQFKADAMREAERLASGNAGEVFYVLKATAAIVAEKPVIQKLKLVQDQIPF